MDNAVDAKDIKVRQAFINAVDVRIGMPVVDPYWQYYIDAYEDTYGYSTKWDNFCEMISTSFSGSLSEYRSEYKTCRDNLMALAVCLRGTKMNFSGANETLMTFLSNLKNDRSASPIMRKGGYYLSIDIKEAFPKVLDYMGVLNGETFEEYISKYITHAEIMNWRGNRLDALKRMERYIGDTFLPYWEFMALSRIYDSDHEIIKYIKENNLKLAKINGDEMMFEIGEVMNVPQEFIDKWCKEEVDMAGLICHVRILQYGVVHYKINGQERWKTYYDNYVTGNRKYNAKNCLYIHQLDKLYRGKKLTEKDKVIKNGSGIRKFTDTIEILKD